MMLLYRETTFVVAFHWFRDRCPDPDAGQGLVLCFTELHRGPHYALPHYPLRFIASTNCRHKEFVTQHRLHASIIFALLTSRQERSYIQRWHPGGFAIPFTMIRRACSSTSRPISIRFSIQDLRSATMLKSSTAHTQHPI